MPSPVCASVNDTTLPPGEPTAALFETHDALLLLMPRRAVLSRLEHVVEVAEATVKLLLVLEGPSINVLAWIGARSLVLLQEQTADNKRAERSLLSATRPLITWNY